ncbi:MAG: lipid-A-disaccharide synthase, partial [Bacteroidaceae bacterium]
PVVLHAKTILRAMKRCHEAIINQSPDALILIDYPGFNLNMARYVKQHTTIPVFYYISPKIWAWKEHRIKDIKLYVDRLYSILPFEVPFFTQKHNYPIDYVGNPSVDEIYAWKSKYTDTHHQFLEKHKLPDKPIIALLPGSRKQEITDNFKRMITAALPYTKKGYQLLVAAANDIDNEFYTRHIKDTEAQQNITLIRNHTFEILANAEAGLITSGTATLETALFRVPQIVCYYFKMGKFFDLMRKLFLKVKYISLVNLIVNRSLVPELVGDQMNVSNIRKHLSAILEDGKARAEQLKGYDEMARLLGEAGAPQRAARLMVERLKNRNMSGKPLLLRPENYNKLTKLPEKREI